MSITYAHAQMTEERDLQSNQNFSLCRLRCINLDNLGGNTSGLIIESGLVLLGYFAFTHGGFDSIVVRGKNGI